MRVCKKCGLEKADDQYRHHVRPNGSGWTDGECRDCRKKEDADQKRKKRRSPDGAAGYRNYQRNLQRRNAADLNFAKARLVKTGRYSFGLTCLGCGVEIPEHLCKETAGCTVDEALVKHPSCPDCGSKWLVPFVQVKDATR